VQGAGGHGPAGQEGDTLFFLFFFSFLIRLASGHDVHVSKPNIFLPHQH
jgi:hypothetical protein